MAGKRLVVEHPNTRRFKVDIIDLSIIIVDLSPVWICYLIKKKKGTLVLKERDLYAFYLCYTVLR
jgi:hypothetical protein